MNFMNYKKFQTDIKNIISICGADGEICIGNNDFEEFNFKYNIQLPECLRIYYSLVESNILFGEFSSFRIYNFEEVNVKNTVTEGKYIVFADNTNSIAGYFLNEGKVKISYGNPDVWYEDIHDDLSEFLVYNLSLNLMSKLSNIVYLKLNYKKTDLENQYIIPQKQLELNVAYSMRNTYYVILYDISKRIIASFDADRKPKLIIASDNISEIEKYLLDSKYKIDWIKQNGKRDVSEKYLFSEIIPDKYESRLELIYEIYFGKRKEEIDKYTALTELPEEISLFYNLFEKKRKIFNSAYIIPERTKIRITDGKFVLAVEEQGVCEYYLNMDDRKIYYHSDDYTEALNTDIRDFLIYLLVLQGTGFMNGQAEIQKKDAELYFGKFTVNETDIYFNTRLRMIGFCEKGEENIYLLSTSASAMEKFGNKTGMIISY